MAFKLESYLLMFIVFSFVIVASIVLVADVNTNYGTNMSTSGFNDTYNTINDMYNLTQDMKNKTFNADVETGLQSTNNLIQGAYSAITLIRGTFSLSGVIINDVANELNVPGYMVKFAISALTIFVIVGVILLIMRLRS